MLSLLGSVASQGGIIKYQDITVEKRGIIVYSNYGSTRGDNFYYSYSGDATNDPAFTITNITNDGINLQFILPYWCGRVMGDAGGQGNCYIAYTLHYTDGTSEWIIGTSATDQKGGTQGAVTIQTPLPLTRVVPLNGKTPYSINHWFQVTGSYPNNHTESQTWVYYFLKIKE